MPSAGLMTSARCLADFFRYNDLQPEMIAAQAHGIIGKIGKHKFPFLSRRYWLQNE
jgi:hypothetical protein